MAATFVVDASVIVEFLVPGRWAAAANRFMSGLAWPIPLELFAPDLIHLEVGNALRKLTLSGALPATVTSLLVARMPDLAIATVGARALVGEAWSLHRQMTVYDASYAVLARQLGCPLVTTDERLARACATAEIAAYEIDDPTLEAILSAFENALP